MGEVTVVMVTAGTAGTALGAFVGWVMRRRGWYWRRPRLGKS